MDALRDDIVGEQLYDEARGADLPGSDGHRADRDQRGGAADAAGRAALRGAGAAGDERRRPRRPLSDSPVVEATGVVDLARRRPDCDRGILVAARPRAAAGHLARAPPPQVTGAFCTLKNRWVLFVPLAILGLRSAERRVGKEGVRTC